MLSNFLFLSATVLLHLLASTTTALTLPTKRSTDFVPFHSLGGVGAVLRNSGGDTQLYYQATDGSIWAYETSAAFDAGTTNFNNILIPAGEVLVGTPIIAVTNDDFTEIHVFFVSPTHILSEWRWDADTEIWTSGASCTTCITNAGFVVQNGGTLLYALTPKASGELGIRIGFESAGEPTTLVEAENHNIGDWQMFTLPN